MHVLNLLTQVEFTGEDGTDTGGLRREFFRLLRTDLSGSYLNCTGGFQHNSVALQVYVRTCMYCGMYVHVYTHEL